MELDSSYRVTKLPTLAYGGVQKYPCRAEKVEEFLVGRPWSDPATLKCTPTRLPSSYNHSSPPRIAHIPLIFSFRFRYHFHFGFGFRRRCRWCWTTPGEQTVQVFSRVTCDNVAIAVKPKPNCQSANPSLQDN